MEPWNICCPAVLVPPYIKGTSLFSAAPVIHNELLVSWMVGIIPKEAVPSMSLAAVQKEWGCELLAAQANNSCVLGSSVQ